MMPSLLVSIDVPHERVAQVSRRAASLVTPSANEYDGDPAATDCRPTRGHGLVVRRVQPVDDAGVETRGRPAPDSRSSPMPSSMATKVNSPRLTVTTRDSAAAAEATVQLLGAAPAEEQHAVDVQRAPRHAGTAERPRGGTLHIFRARARRGKSETDRLQHPAATPAIRLRTATRVAQDAPNGYDPRHLDMLTPDRPRRCRAQLAYARAPDCKRRHARARFGRACRAAHPLVWYVRRRDKAAGGPAPRWAGLAMRRSPRVAGSLAGYPAGDGGSGVGVLSTRR